jgi:hypothetical protein
MAETFFPTVYPREAARDAPPMLAQSVTRVSAQSIRHVPSLGIIRPITESSQIEDLLISELLSFLYSRLHSGTRLAVKNQFGPPVGRLRGQPAFYLVSQNVQIDFYNSSLYFSQQTDRGKRNRDDVISSKNLKRDIGEFCPVDPKRYIAIVGRIDWTGSR